MGEGSRIRLDAEGRHEGHDGSGVVVFRSLDP